MDRFCRQCGKVLSRTQTKFCCRDHWFLFEKENTRAGRLSGSKKVGVGKRKLMVCDEEC